MRLPRALVNASIPALLMLTTPAFGLVVSLNLGTGSPPASLGGHSMVPFSDPRQLGDPVLDVAPPPGALVTGDLLFDNEVTHHRVGQGWDTWSHGYTGDVYSFDEILWNSSTLTLTLPADTKAFYLYAEPDFFGDFTFEISSGGASEILDISGKGGAKGVGFYTDDPALESLTSVVITRLSPDIPGFAVGNFGINGTATLPDSPLPPAMTGLLFLVVLAMAQQRRG